MPAPVEPLEPGRLTRRCDPAVFGFATTDDVDADLDLVGQPRVAEALEFGVGIDDDGYNMFALGPPGTGKRTFVEHALRRHAATRPTPDDLCYVEDFAEPNRPRALHLPPGDGRRLRDDLLALVADVAGAVPAAFESDAYQAARNAIDETYKRRQSERFEAVERLARERDVAMIQTPVGFMFAAVRDGEVVESDAFAALPEPERRRVQAAIEDLQRELQAVLREAPRWERERQARQRALARDTARHATEHATAETQARWRAHPAATAHLEALARDLVEHAPRFLRDRGDDEPSAPGREADAPWLRRYAVNVVVDHGAGDGAPVVYEDHPTLPNLVGRTEHLAQMGTLVTDFTLIRGGALHRANGGYLILDALALLRQPFAWDALVRVLRSRELRPESPAQAYGLASTVTLEPEPVPLDVKVALLGDRKLYYLLSALDADFLELFKVAVDFDDEVDRDDATERGYGRLVAAMVRRNGFRPFTRDALARVVERVSRLAGDATKLSARTAWLADLLREASFAAERAGTPEVGPDAVRAATWAQDRRRDRIRERLLASTLRGVLHVATEGDAVGQVNGLSVLQLGDYAFGRPSRITATARPGRGEVVDIEREVELGGPLHAKGVLILAGCLGARFGRDAPLSLSASLVFEQSYGGVEGDSASSAEACALLSAIGDLPVRQGVAVTGSIDQRGRIQPVGGVNEKIEGFFELCRARGLDGSHGVAIPRANVDHLMLDGDVVDAVTRGAFHVWPLDTLDEAIELLTGLPMGRPDVEGRYPEGSAGHRIQARLASFGAAMRAQAAPTTPDA